MSSTPSQDLCLACSSSLPPNSKASITTACCSRIICEQCLTRNPRLRWYNPCLRCLNGVDATSRKKGGQEIVVPSVTGAPLKKEEDTFVLGDDDEDEENEMEGGTEAKPTQAELSQHDASRDNTKASSSNSTPEAAPMHDAMTGAKPSAPPNKYYIKKGDTLAGISLKFRVDRRELCRLNNLPPSTLTTTPHLLHTRTTLTLPKTDRIPSPPPPDAEEKEVQRAQERAAKRFQFVTKVVDWRIAKAYVALAEDDDDLKPKEGGERVGGGSGGDGAELELKAVDRFLDDDEWEAEERRQGRGPKIPGFPYFKPKT